MKFSRPTTHPFPHDPRILHTFLRSALATIALLFAVSTVQAQGNTSQCPPTTRTDNVVDNYFGTKISDPYRWLEDQNSSETRAWIAAEDACTNEALDKLPGRDGMSRRLGQLMKVDSVGPPIARNGRYFFMKRAANEDLYIIYMRNGLAGADQVLVDPRPLSKDHSTSVDLQAVSDDGKMIAYGIRQGGQDQVTVHFLDVDTRHALADVLPRADYEGVSINHEKSGVYYARTTEQGPRVFYHAMGRPAAADAKIFGDGYGTGEFINAYLSENNRYLVMEVSYGASGDRSDVYVKNVESNGPIMAIAKGLQAGFNPIAAGDTLYLETNWKAENWRVLAVDLKNPARDKWREIIPESKDRLADVEAAGEKLIATYVHNATTSVRIFDADGKSAGEIALPALGTGSVVSTQWKSNEVFLGFESYAYPPVIYRYDLASQKMSVWAKPQVPIQSSDFTVTQIWYHSKDGTPVPMFLFYKKGLKLDGNNPTLLTGYGGFDVSVTPSFSSEAVLWAEHGGVWAEANMRGGGEFGQAWHVAGMREKKQNVFDDFESAGQWLNQNKYTNPNKLAIMGESNGGLLMGAALTQRPDLFRAVVCMYPLLDMLRFQKFLVARWWVPEYGSAENAEQFKYLRAYSPYQNVHKGTKYPAVLFITGDGDTRVAPLHARKMTAMLQASTGSDRPILLMYDTKSGHSGGRPLGQQIAEDTNILSFLFWQLGATQNANQ
ncbi:MAG: prolyl oligopeptidase family serine peptidase [Candidatus Acidiferrales bacterium]